MRKPLKGVVFEQDVYLAKADQTAARLKIAKWAKERGFSRFGAEFLFIDLVDAKNIDKLEKDAREIIHEYQNLFDESYFSIHFPWMPTGKSALESSEKACALLERLLAFAPDHIAQINVHFGVVPREEMKKFGSMEGKRDALRALGGILSDLPERGKRVVIETLPSPSDMADAFFYSGVLPSDFKLALSNNHAGMTIDTAHTGINQYRCRHMVKTGELLEGFSKTDKKEIEALAKDPITPYLDAVGKVRHVHFSDYLTPRGVLPQDGIVFGKGKQKSSGAVRIVQHLHI
jgi:sugar phosphate isomerase/epimerase